MSRFGVGLDIGTTTIQAQLVNLDTCESLDTFSALNDQRTFGADVISRINAASGFNSHRNGKLGELFSTVNKQTESILRQFIKKYNLSSVTQCAVSANTTMLHLFCNVDPSGMGRAPYIPKFLDERRLKGEELSLSAEQIILLPGVSAFIGADITAGLAFVDIMKTEKDFKSVNALFIDIGTNGEIAVWKESEKRIFCCSTAAGPCFEEAQVNCSLSAADFINAAAEMKRDNIIDETGALAEKFIKDGFSPEEGKIITQKDIRQLQLAKSAIYSGIKTICKTAKLDLAGINKVYIAGGLGEYLNLESAAEIGLLPREFTDARSAVKTIVCGNTSLKGAVKSLTDSAFLPRCREIITCAETIELANNKYFAAAFEHNMWF